MDFSSGKGVVRGRSRQQLEFVLGRTQAFFQNTINCSILTSTCCENEDPFQDLGYGCCRYADKQTKVAPCAHNTNQIQTGAPNTHAGMPATKHTIRNV